ncbi:MAG: glycosyltransferase 87 family protein [Kocuria sp.]|nr:glycosyltransferase 87 family protein [Kocuria sp.]
MVADAKILNDSARSLKKNDYRAIFIYTLFAVLIRIVIEGSVYSPVDFFVYKFTANNIFSGKEIIGVLIEDDLIGSKGLPFVYTPGAAVLLSPLAWIGAWPAYYMWTAASAWCFFYISLKAIRWSLFKPGKLVIFLVLAVTLATNVYMHHIIFGQINVFLAALIIYDLTRSSARIPVGFYVGIAAAIKLTPAIFILYLFWVKEWSKAGWSLAGAVSLTILGAAFLPRETLQYFSYELFNLSTTVSLDGFFTTSGNGSLSGVLSRHLGIEQGTWWSTVVSLVLIPVFMTISTGWWKSGEKIIGVCLIGILACLVSPVSWTHHWVYLIPASIMLVFSANLASKFFGMLCFLVMCFQVPDLGDWAMQNSSHDMVGIYSLMQASMVFCGLFLVPIGFYFKGKSAGSIFDPADLPRVPN